MTTSSDRKPRKVKQYTLEKEFIKEFPSISGAARATNTDGGNIVKVCKGTQGHTNGFIWEYSDDPTKQQVTIRPLESLYNEIKQAVEYYCKLQDGYSDVITLWILGTYFISEINIFPRLVITAPERGCGKSQVLKIIKALTVNSKKSVNPTSAVLFRIGKHDEPIRLIDEAENWITTNLDAIDILNEGFERGGVIERCNQATGEPEEFDVYMPIVLAGILVDTKMKDSTLSRSVVLHIQKESGAPKAELPVMEQKYESLRAKAVKVIEPLKKPYTTKSPPLLTDERMRDTWAPLFSIADMIGTAHSQLVLNAYQAFGEDYEESDIGVLVIQTVKRVLDHSSVIRKKVTGTRGSYIKTKSLYDHVINDAEFKELDKPISQHSFTRIIKAYRVESKKLKFEGSRSNISALNEVDLKKAIAKYSV